jgi:hypothetical protein
MEIPGSIPQLVCVMPFELKAGVDVKRLRAAGAESLEHPVWSSYFPEQFRRSFAGAVVVGNLVSGDGRESPPGIHPCLADPRFLAVFLDETTACLVAVLNIAPEARSSRTCRSIYDEVCRFQETAAPKLVTRFLESVGAGSGEPEFTWGFSINLLFAYQGKIPRDRLLSAFRAICHTKEPDEAITANASVDATMEHYVGTTGAMCIVSAENEPKYSWRRVIGLWMAFQCYYAIAQNRYLSFSRSDAPKWERRSRKKLERDIKYYDENYSRTMRLINIFDPINVCTRGFDEAIYESSWDGFGADRLNQKLQNVMSLFIQNGRDLRGELTRRYETVVQLTLFVLTFTQMAPIIDGLVATQMNRYLPQSMISPTAISLLLMAALALLVSALARWSSRW